MLSMLMSALVESRARRAAKRIGLVARKTRWRKDTIDNFGGFQIVDPRGNMVVGGSRYDLTADEVIEWCSNR
jgi:hypothetical protein